jgi:hypothetical protein
MNEKRKRAAPTIDLTANEVPAASAEGDGQTNIAPESPSPEQGAVQPGKDAPSDELPTSPSATSPHFHAGWTASIAGGFVGAFLVALLAAALWYAGVLPERTVAPNDQTAQIATLQKQIADLQTRSVPAVDNAAVDGLHQRLGKLENDIAQLPLGDKTVAERLTAADNAMKSLGIALAALNKRSDDLAAKASQAQETAAAAEKAVDDLRGRVQSAGQAASAIDSAALDALQKRVATAEQAVAAARAQLADNTASDKAIRLALSTTALREAVERGAPYKTELAQVKALGADEKTLAPLDQFAASGLPGKTDLARQLSALIPAMLKAVGGETTSGGFFERLQANANKLVRIQPINAPVGDHPSDLLARIEVEAAHADIDAALADIGKLPETVRRPAADWMNTAAARQKALAAAQAVAADAARALGQPLSAGAPGKP